MKDESSRQETASGQCLLGDSCWDCLAG